jgi:MmyB-like transcription regulator ligand binding domain
VVPRVPDGVRRLLETLTDHPAWVRDRTFDVLAVNPLAAALSPHYRPGDNLLRAAFLDPAERELRRDWADATREGVAHLRALVGADVDDPAPRRLVAELSARSEWFRELWERYEARPKTDRVSLLDQPLVGPLELHSTKLAVGGVEGLLLVVCHALPGSRSAEMLRILGSLRATGPRP